MSLGKRLAVRFAFAFIAALVVLFLPAGTWKFWQGWAFLATFFIPYVLTFLYFYKYDPKVVERRLQSNEPVSEQKALIRWARPLFIASFPLPGLDYRFGWSRMLVGAMPVWLTIFSLLMVLAGILGVFWVLKVNAHASRTIQVEEGQTVISTGPYRVVRHPLYTASVVLWVFTPLALGSYVSLPVFLVLVSFYVLRLLSEEKVLRVELPGYSEYCAKTRFHLIPLVW